MFVTLNLSYIKLIVKKCSKTHFGNNLTLSIIKRAFEMSNKCSECPLLTIKFHFVHSRQAELAVAIERHSENLQILNGKLLKNSRGRMNISDTASLITTCNILYTIQRHY